MPIIENDQKVGRVSKKRFRLIQFQFLKMFFLLLFLLLLMLGNEDDHMAQNDLEGEEEEDGDDVDDTCIFKQLDQIIVEECD